MSKEKPKPGPEADRLKLEGDWKDKLAKAAKKPRPNYGWPKRKFRKQAKKKD